MPEGRPGALWITIAFCTVGVIVAGAWRYSQCTDEREREREAEARERDREERERVRQQEAAELARTAPKLPARAQGEGWFCTEHRGSGRGYDNTQSTCARTLDGCNAARTRMAQEGVSYSPCQPQGRAACFTFYRKLEQQTSFDCSANFRACESQRLYATGRSADVSNVSRCEGFN